jgi:hypothetical protein
VEPTEFRLGNVRFSKATDDIIVASMIAQKGYGPSPKPRIRYAALENCLQKVAHFAQEKDASLHMPQIGTGQAGGSWPIIEELIDTIICGPGTAVTVYTPPGRDSNAPGQQSLDFRETGG